MEQLIDKDEVITNDSYWDCNCDENYIHFKSELQSCVICGAIQTEQPDSMQNEIDVLKLYKVWSKEYINWKAKIFPSPDEYHGRYLVQTIPDLKKQLVARGFNPKECHWELQKKKND